MQEGYAGPTRHVQVHPMSTITGKTHNDFTYEGDYDLAGRGRLNWTATYRKDGAFCGMRNGRLENMAALTSDDCDAAVRRAIETKWTDPEAQPG